MTLTTVLIVALTWALGAAPDVSPRPQGDDKREVAQVISNALTLLKRQDYAGFFKTAVRPGEVAELVEKYGSLEKAAAEFGKSPRSAALIKVLEAALPLEPSFNSAGDRATIAFATPVERERRLTLQKVASTWYLRN